MKITIDRTACYGLGACESAAPEVFEVGDDGKAHLVADPTDLARYRVAIAEAVNECPMRALLMEV
ncbi:ferredoxin [Gordonia terrae]